LLAVGYWPHVECLIPLSKSLEIAVFVGKMYAVLQPKPPAQMFAIPALKKAPYRL
jgi:hypothetical protein